MMALVDDYKPPSKPRPSILFYQNNQKGHLWAHDVSHTRLRGPVGSSPEAFKISVSKK